MSYKRTFYTTEPNKIKSVVKEYPGMKFSKTKQGADYVIEGPIKWKATIDMLAQLYDR